MTDTTDGGFRTFSAVPAPPDPAGAVDLADFIEHLRLLRAHAGSPSFRVLAKRVGPLLRPPQEVTHSTVSDAFDPARRRLNLELVAAIVQALGVSEAQVPRWRAACVAAHVARRPAGTAGVFRQLPAELATFTGRRAELAELMGLVELVGLVESGAAAAPRTVVVSAIEGMAGVGKTQLVIRAAHELVRAGRFADVQLYVNLRGFDADAAPADPADVLDSFLRQLEVPARRIPAERDARAAMFRDRIAGRDALVVLDNAADETQVADLIPADPRCLVLVTSRRNLAGLDGAHLFRLDVFPLGDALELLARVVGDERVAAEPQAAVEVVELCGLLPLAVSLAAARLRSRPAWSLARLATHLRDSGLDAVRAGSRELRPVFDLSYRELPAATARAFRLVSLHPGRGFTTGAVAALTGTSLTAARGALEALIDENLVEQRTADRYELHDLLHAYAVERAETDESAAERDEALARLVSWYLHTAENVSRAVESRRLLETLPPRPGEPEPPVFDSALEAMAWYDAERENLSAVLQSAADAGRPELALRLPVTLLGCYQMRKDWTRWRSAYETGLASRAPDRRPHRAEPAAERPGTGPVRPAGVQRGDRRLQRRAGGGRGAGRPAAGGLDPGEHRGLLEPARGLRDLRADAPARAGAVPRDGEPAEPGLLADEPRQHAARGQAPGGVPRGADRSPGRGPRGRQPALRGDHRVQPRGGLHGSRQARRGRGGLSLGADGFAGDRGPAGGGRGPAVAGAAAEGALDARRRRGWRCGPRWRFSRHWDRRRRS